MAKNKKRKKTKKQIFYAYGDKWFLPDKRYKKKESYLNKFYELNKSRIENSYLADTPAGAFESFKFHTQEYLDENLDLKSAVKRLAHSGKIYSKEVRERYFIQEKFKEHKDLRAELLDKLGKKQLRYKNFRQVEDYERTDTKDYYMVFRYGDSDYGFGISRVNNSEEAYEYTLLGGLA